MNSLGGKKLVQLSNWSIKFIEGVNNDFDVVLKGVVGENNIFLTTSTKYITDPIIRVVKFNTILCEDNVYVTLESPINERKMVHKGFTIEFISCFRYGFPTNWVAIIENFFSQVKSKNDLSLPGQLLDVASRDMNKYKDIYTTNATSIKNWYLDLHLSENEDDFYVVLIGYLDCASDIYNDHTYCEAVVRDREDIDVILCGKQELYKLVTPIDSDKMAELGYSVEIIECFRFGFPSNWSEIWLEFFNQYEGLAESYGISSSLATQAIEEMDSFRCSQQLDDSIFKGSFTYEETQYPHKDITRNMIDLRGEGVIEVESSMPYYLLSGSFKSNEDKFQTLHKVDTPVTPCKEIKGCFRQTQKVLLGDICNSESPVSSPSLLNSFSERNDFPTPYSKSLSVQNINDGTQLTNFFPLTGTSSLSSGIYEDYFEEESQNKNQPLEMSKINTINHQSIDYNTNPERFFNATLGLADIENTSRGMFNITGGSFNLSISSNNDSEKTKRPVYYLPAAKYIVKSKNKPKKPKVREVIEKRFDFEKLVYEEIERKRNYDSYNSNDFDDSLM
uniref:SANTA domain-containing protein n=1 Tax=Strongyloides papillosus TaxID=174720 RepID=A0A0N5BIG3_STREA